MYEVSGRPGLVHKAARRTAPMVNMEIEFNPSKRSAVSLPSDSVSRPARRPPAASEAVSMGNSSDLEGKLNETPLVRPDKVDQVSTSILDQKYPPDVMVDRIANLLAIHMSN